MENNDNEFSISLQQVAKDMELESIYDGGGIEDRMISSRDINRCGQQLMGYLDYFDSERIQIIGLVECTYLESLAPKDRLDSIEAVLSRKIPALIITRDLRFFLKFSNLQGKIMFRYSRLIMLLHHLWLRLSLILTKILHRESHATAFWLKSTVKACLFWAKAASAKAKLQ